MIQSKAISFSHNRIEPVCSASLDGLLDKASLALSPDAAGFGRT